MVEPGGEAKGTLARGAENKEKREALHPEVRGQSSSPDYRSMVQPGRPPLDFVISCSLHLPAAN